jgi:hypothetical protein
MLQEMRVTLVSKITTAQMSISVDEILISEKSEKNTFCAFCAFYALWFLFSVVRAHVAFSVLV